MKRARKKTSVREINAFTGNRLKSALAAACLDKYDEYGEDLLSNQPIILRCRSDKATFDHAIAYWPSDSEIGEKLLALLNRLLHADDKDEHVWLVVMIRKHAMNLPKTHGSHEKKIRKLLEEATGSDTLDDLGIFSLLRPDFYSHESEKKAYDNPSLFLTDYSQLSPYLYHHQCIAYWFYQPVIQPKLSALDSCIDDPMNNRKK